MNISQTIQFAFLALFSLAFAGCGSKTELKSDLSVIQQNQGATVNTSMESNADETLLSERLAAKAKVSAESAPVERRKNFKAGIDIVRESGIERTARQVGDTAIDGELIGWDGNTIRLSELWSKGPVILMWYRGGWCPYCNIQLRAMQQSLDKIENAGARLVVLTPEMPEKAKETADANDINIVALHDRDNHLALKYGILFDLPEPIVPIYRDKLKLPSYNGTDKLQLPLAATYVIDSSGHIAYAFLDADYKKRAEPSEVIAAVNKLTK